MKARSRAKSLPPEAFRNMAPPQISQQQLGRIKPHLNGQGAEEAVHCLASKIEMPTNLRDFNPK